MINYHSDNYIDRNMYFRHRVCFNGTFCASDLVLSEVENRGQDIRRIARKKAGRELWWGNQKEKEEILDLEEEKLQNLSN